MKIVLLPVQAEIVTQGTWCKLPPAGKVSEWFAL